MPPTIGAYPLIGKVRLRMVYYLETRSTDPYYNLAFEEYVLTHRTEGDYLLLWQNDNTVVVGRNQNTAEEINADFVEAHHIRVVRRVIGRNQNAWAECRTAELERDGGMLARRLSGGGAVYHDLGNLNYSFITDAGEKEKLSFARFTEPVVKALCELGLSASASGRNDILVDGCKVSGTAQRLSGDRVLHHGTLLFDSDPSLVAGALTVHPEKFQSKSAKSVRARIGNIRSFLREDMTLPAFWEYLRTALAQGAFQETTLTEEELREVQRLRDEKYATWDWNYGKSPAYDMVNHRRFAGGTLEVHMNVRSGVIREIAFSGDFLSRRELAPVTEALCGCAVEPESVDRVLHQFPLEEYFGTITVEEVRDTVCNRGGVE